MPTCFIPPNGFGAMYQAIIYGYAFCRRLNLEYEHTPLGSIHHNCNTPRANKLIGFSGHPRAKRDSKRLAYGHIEWVEPVHELFTAEVLSEIRSEYGVQFLPDNMYKTKKYVAVHIRRGDVTQDKHPDRWISMEKYKGWIKELHSIYPDHEIIIFSEGQQKDFNFPSYAKLHLGGDPLEVFNMLKEADVLFPARSSFSFTAGILSTGIVYQDVYADGTYWHTPHKDWLRLTSSMCPA